jgi:cytoplasmic polyadenylation element-binding protein
MSSNESKKDADRGLGEVLDRVVDRGAQFSLSPDFRLIIRKRSNTFPSTDKSSLINGLYDLSDNDSETNDALERKSPSIFTPIKPKNETKNASLRNVYNSNDYRSTTGMSPMTPTTPEMSANKHCMSQYDRTYSPIPTFANMGSPIPNTISSLLTPVSLINSPQIPQQLRYLNYNPFLSHQLGSPYDDYSNAVRFSQRFNQSDRVTDLVRQHKNAATHAEARHTWSGVLPMASSHKPPIYSCKVFVGGVPWEMTDHDIKLTFSRFGNVTILRPGQHVKLSRSSQNKDKAGYLYLIFESDKHVKSLINACTHDFSNGGKFYFALNQSRYRPKDVQIIPWNTNDVNYVRNPSARLDTSKTVFVGALHGMLTAEGLACILEDLFGNVVYVGIDTDKYKYPIGSGRVTFSTTKAFNKAVMAAFIDVKSNRFQKKIQIDPFLEESNCSHCHSEKGPIFCRDLCMTYFCRNCWDILHSMDGMRGHQPIMRTKTF